jgi:hypothetical protein
LGESSEVKRWKSWDLATLQASSEHLVLKNQVDKALMNLLTYLMQTFSDEVLVEYRVLMAFKYCAFSSCVLRYLRTMASRLAKEMSLCGD